MPRGAALDEPYDCCRTYPFGGGGDRPRHPRIGQWRLRPQVATRTCGHSDEAIGRLGFGAAPPCLRRRSAPASGIAARSAGPDAVSCGLDCGSAWPFGCSPTHEPSRLGLSMWGAHCGRGDPCSLGNASIAGSTWDVRWVDPFAYTEGGTATDGTCFSLIRDFAPRLCTKCNVSRSELAPGTHR